MSRANDAKAYFVEPGDIIVEAHVELTVPDVVPTRFEGSILCISTGIGIKKFIN